MKKEIINGVEITDIAAAEKYAIEKMGKDATRRHVDIAYSQWFNKLKAEYSSLLTTNGFIVLSVLMGSYQPTFHEDEKLMFFATEQEAQTAIDECIADVKQAVIAGDMSDEYSQDDYKIIPARLEGETVTCIVDDERYTMQRSDDDFTRVAHPLAQ